MIVNPQAILPENKVFLEKVSFDRATRVIIVISRDRQRWRKVRVTKSQSLCGVDKFLLERKIGRVSGKNQVVNRPRFYLFQQHRDNLVSVSKSLASAKETNVDPARHSLAEPVSPPPSTSRKGEMHITEMCQPNRSMVDGFHTIYCSPKLIIEV
jgi:hypothetical protein